MCFVRKAFNLKTIILENQSSGFYQFFRIVLCFIYVQMTVLLIQSKCEIETSPVRQFIAYTIYIVINGNAIINHSRTKAVCCTDFWEIIPSKVSKISVPYWHTINQNCLASKFRSVKGFWRNYLCLVVAESNIWIYRKFYSWFIIHSRGVLCVVKPLYDGIYLISNTHLYIFHFDIYNNVLVSGVLHIYTNLKPRIFFSIKFHRHSMCKIGSSISGFCCFIDRR